MNMLQVLEGVKEISETSVKLKLRKRASRGGNTFRKKEDGTFNFEKGMKVSEQAREHNRVFQNDGA